jgi:hypothetical protein
MKKIIVLLLISNIVLSGFFLLGKGSSIENIETVQFDTIYISKPVITDDGGGFVNILLEEANSYKLETGRPILPIITKNMIIPFGSKILDIDVEIKGVKEILLNKPIKPCSAPIALTNMIENENILQKDEKIYGKDNFYPDLLYDCTLGSGLSIKEHVLYLNLQCYPIRYLPQSNIIQYCDSIDISITFQMPNSQSIFPDVYDMIIIAPEQFRDELESLVIHKNNYEVKTILKTTEEIYGEYEGFDKPEQIKYFIKDALDEWGVHYVLLVGGLNSLLKANAREDANQGSIDWYVPVRYTNLRMVGGGPDDPGYISDLYFADIYDSEGNFSSWDQDKNGESDGIYASWKLGSNRDVIDLYPDVYVGRLPCRNEREVEIMVDKIINYEKTSSDPSWFNNLVLIGGDTFDDTGSNNYYEGEAENQKAIDYMTGFNSIKIWSSNKESGGLVPEPKDVISTVSNGCGFLFFAGHGSPELWETHWAGGPFDRASRTEAIMWYNLYGMKNDYKLPICVVGSCHGSQFNITGLLFLNYWLRKIADFTGLDFLNRPPTNVASFTPECFTWVLTKVNGGGSLATIGNTGIGYGRVGNSGDLDGDGIDDPDCVEKLGGYIETQFFKAYGQDKIEILGETWGAAVTNYLNVYPGMKDKTDCKTVQQWVLFGDPSIKIGGYE